MQKSKKGNHDPVPFKLILDFIPYILRGMSFKHIHLNSVNIRYGKIPVTTFQYLIICYAYKNKHIIIFFLEAKSLIQVNIGILNKGGLKISDSVKFLCFYTWVIFTIYWTEFFFYSYMSI